MEAFLLGGPKYVFVIVDWAVLFLAIITNCLVLRAIINTKFNLIGYRRFLTSLASSQLYVCGVNLALFLFEILTWYLPNHFGMHCESQLLRSFQLTGFFANLLNLLGLSTDHFVGTVFPMKYKILMNKPIAKWSVLFIWLFSFLIGFADWPVAAFTNYYYAQSTSTNHSSSSSIANQINGRVNNKMLCSPESIVDIVGNFNTDTGAWLKNLQLTLPDREIINKKSPNNTNNNNIKKGGRKEKKANDQNSLIRSAKPRTSYKDKFTGLTTSNNKTTDIPLLTVKHNRPHNGISTTKAPQKRQTVVHNFDVSRLSAMLLADRDADEASQAILCEAFSNVGDVPLSDKTWCPRSHFNNSSSWLEVSIMSLTFVCFIISTIFYGTIFRQIFGRHPGHYTKIVTTCLQLVVFAICMTFDFFWMVWFDVSHVQSSSTLMITQHAFNSMLLAYPFLDPLLFMVRSPTVMRNVNCPLLDWGCFRRGTPNSYNLSLVNTETSNNKQQVLTANLAPKNNHRRLSALAKLAISGRHHRNPHNHEPLQGASSLNDNNKLRTTLSLISENQ